MGSYVVVVVVHTDGSDFGSVYTLRCTYGIHSVSCTIYGRIPYVEACSYLIFMIAY